MSKVYRGDHFKNLKLNPSVKSKEGFITAMLEALHERYIHAKETMAKPRGFHLVLTEVDRSKLGYIPRIISRWAEQRSKCPLSYMTGKYHFVKAEEIRPIKREFHVHLQLICDGITHGDIQSLKEALYIVAKKTSLKNRALKYRKIKVHPLTSECLTNPETGEFLREGCKWSHDLHGDYEDFFERASYICKVKTKVSLSSWSCNKLIKPNQPQAVRVHQKIAEQYIKAKPNADFIQFNQPLVSFSQLQSNLISNQEPTELQSNVSEFRHEIDQKKIQ